MLILVLLLALVLSLALVAFVTIPRAQTVRQDRQRIEALRSDHPTFI